MESVQPPEHVADLYRLSDPALSDLGLEALLDELLTRLREILDVDTAAILLVDEDHGALVPRAANGLEERGRGRNTDPVGKGFAGRIAAERVPVAISNLKEADVVNPILRERGIQRPARRPPRGGGQRDRSDARGEPHPREFADGDAVVLELAAARPRPRSSGPGSTRPGRRAPGAVALQRSMLPERLPDLPTRWWRPATSRRRDEVGGDWYDVLTLPHGRIGLAIGDVAGHGVRAATLMGSVRTALRAYALEDHSPGVVLGLLDRMLRVTRERAMATVIYAIIDPETGRIRYASAGHPPPVLVGEEGARLMEPATGPPVGTLVDSVYGEVELEMPAGETLLLYTDGLVEVRGESLDRGLERLAPPPER